MTALLPTGSGNTGRREPPPDAAWWRALVRVADLVGTGATWMLTGSAALAAWGARVTPKDVDVITNMSGIAVLRQLVAQAIVDEPFNKPGVRAAARLGFRLEGVSIDVLVDVRNRRPDGSWSVASSPNAGVPVRYLGKVVPVTPLPTLYRIAEERGRHDQVTAIRNLLAQNGSGTVRTD
jgi:hypothetical protein